jgi:hydroxypyruvate isomerase
MAKISICIEMLFTEVDFLERPAAAAAAGFEAVEFWGSGNKDLDALQKACVDAGVAVATFGSLGGYALVSPQDPDALRETMLRDAEKAQLLGTKTLLVTTGNESEDVSREEQMESIIGNLQAVAPVAEEQGIRLALEMLNTLVDHAGYFLDSTDDALAIVQAVDSPAVGILYDVYHMQIMEGNLIETIRRAAPHLHHVHVADVPGRHEPGTGEINYANVFRAIDEAGYDGWCGMEFRPTGGSAEALEEMMRSCGLR